MPTAGACDSVKVQLTDAVMADWFCGAHLMEENVGHAGGGFVVQASRTPALAVNAAVTRLWSFWLIPANQARAACWGVGWGVDSVDGSAEVVVAALVVVRDESPEDFPESVDVPHAASVIRVVARAMPGRSLIGGPYGAPVMRRRHCVHLPCRMMRHPGAG